MGSEMKRFLLLLVFLALSTLPSAAAKRIALVIGNGDYNHVVDLNNPINDADLMEKTLRDVGFEVMRYNNLDQRGMKQAMLDFGRLLKADTEASMFYYAGHGIEVNGTNYLVPTDADTRSTQEADIQNVSVNAFLGLMESSPVPLNVVVLDACRNNPFRALRSSGSGGLAPVKAPRGTYVAYATAPGTVAADGDGKNSPFTLALAENIKKPGLTLEGVFKQTRLVVQDATAGAQLPFDSSAITGDFYFVPAVATTSVEPTRDVAPKQGDEGQAAFEAAGDDADMLRVVSERFSDTVWGALAAQKLKKLEKSGVDVPAVEKQVVEPVEAKPAKQEPSTALVKDDITDQPIAKRKTERDAKRVDEPKRKIEPQVKIERKVLREKPTRKVVVAKPIRILPKRAVPPKVRVAAPKPRAVPVNLPSCWSNTIRQGQACKGNGTQVCRVAAIQHRRGNEIPIIMGCH
jgi:uncharacterized caspase-like protein